jgi:hypothetical protein
MERQRKYERIPLFLLVLSCVFILAACGSSEKSNENAVSKEGPAGADMTKEDVEEEKPELVYAKDGKLSLENGTVNLEELITKENLPAEADVLLTLAEAEAGTYVEIQSDKKLGWVYDNTGKNYFWNGEIKENTLNIYLYPGAQEERDNTEDGTLLIQFSSEEKEIENVKVFLDGAEIASN